MLHWIRFLQQNQRLEYHILNCLRDQHEQNYDRWSNPDWTRFVLEAYGHSYWITVDPFLADPLPAWAFAVIFLEKPGRFARLTLGHESNQHLRGGQDIRLRVVADYTLRRGLINIFPAHTTTGREQRAFLREIAQWIQWFSTQFPPEFQPPGAHLAQIILQDL